jgi:sugar phosphate isomerase/epimerase
VIAYLVENDRKTIDDYKKHAATFNTAAEKCKKAGIQFAYHNHDFEFIDMNGQTGYEVLMKETDKSLVKFEMDIYWVAKANHDPIELFKKHSNRFPLWHVKDMDKTEKRSFTEVGNGVIDYKKIFENAKKSGMQHFFVEQDISADPLASIQKSFEYIKTSLIKELS